MFFFITMSGSYFFEKSILVFVFSRFGALNCFQIVVEVKAEGKGNGCRCGW